MTLDFNQSAAAGVYQFRIEEAKEYHPNVS